MDTIQIDDIKIRPLTTDTWPDFEQLFGPRGACGGCWCMWWRLSSKEFEIAQGEGNRQAMKTLVDSGVIPGLIGYMNDKSCRHQGVGSSLIRGAIQYVKSCGGEIIEAYPTLVRSDHAPPVSTFMGFPKVFRRLGFQEIKSASSSKVFMRYYL